VELELADQLIAAARAAAEGQELSIAAAVVDESGALRAFTRMDGAGVLAVDISIGKAYTAAAFRRPSADVAASLDGRSDFIARLQVPAHGQLTLAAGGVPVFVDGKCIGAVGVSGATGEQDAAAATTAIAKVVG
jgi:glc operon protein GlcG